MCVLSDGAVRIDTGSTFSYDYIDKAHRVVIFEIAQLFCTTVLSHVFSVFSKLTLLL